MKKVCVEDETEHNVRRQVKLGQLLGWRNQFRRIRLVRAFIE